MLHPIRGKKMKILFFRDKGANPFSPTNNMKYNSLKARDKQKERDKKIAEEKGLTLMEIGKKYDLTKQRVHQIVVKEKRSEPENINIKKVN